MANYNYKINKAPGAAKNGLAQRAAMSLDHKINKAPAHLKNSLQGRAAAMFGYKLNTTAQVGDVIDPIIENVTPAPGQLTGMSIAQRAATNIEFDVTDLSPGLRKVIVWAKLENDAQTVVVYDGNALRYPYLGAQSSVTQITNGLHFSIRPVNGWTSDIEELTVTAIDRAGNEEGD